MTASVIAIGRSRSPIQIPFRGTRNRNASKGFRTGDHRQPALGHIHSQHSLARGVQGKRGWQSQLVQPHDDDIHGNA